MTPQEIYREATTPKTQEQTDNFIKQEAEKRERELVFKRARDSWQQLHFTKEFIELLDNEVDKLKLQVSGLVISGSSANELLRAKLVEQTTLTTVINLMKGKIDNYAHSS